MFKEHIVKCLVHFVCHCIHHCWHLLELLVQSIQIRVYSLFHLGQFAVCGLFQSLPYANWIVDFLLSHFDCVETVIMLLLIMYGQICKELWELCGSSVIWLLQIMDEQWWKCNYLLLHMVTVNSHGNIRSWICLSECNNWSPWKRGTGSTPRCGPVARVCFIQALDLFWTFLRRCNPSSPVSEHA